MIRFIDMHREQFELRLFAAWSARQNVGFSPPAAAEPRSSAQPLPAASGPQSSTCVRIPKGLCDAALFTDVRTRRIKVGWAVAARLPTEALPLQALEHALLCTCAEASS